MRILCGTVGFLLAIGASLRAAPPPRSTIPYRAALDDAAIRVERLDNILDDSLILGNGDANGLLFRDGGDLVLRITKGDVWDARMDTSNDPPPLAMKRIQQLAKGAWPEGGKFTDGFLLRDGQPYTGPNSWRPNPFPCPRMAADVRMAVSGKGARLDLRRATAEVDGSVPSIIRALVGRNVFLIKSDATPRLAPAPRSYEIPPTESGERTGTSYVLQAFPGDLDWPGMSVAVALSVHGKWKAVAIVTSLDAKDPVSEAVRLAVTTLREEPARLIAQHEAEWEQFWAQSGVELADNLLQQTWYQNLYFLRSVSKPGASCVGLYAGQVTDQPAWHGGHTTNYNTEQTFWTALNTNHPEMQEPYDRMIVDYLPRARWLCKKLFDLDGAYYPHNIFLHEPPDPEQCRSRNGRQYFWMSWSYTLGVSGFTVQNLWLKYKYTGDRAYLEKIAYPVVRDVALFYAGFLEQCDRRPDGKAHFGPTVSAEHWGWTQGLDRNWNGTLDIAMARYTLRAALEGGRVLGLDSGLSREFTNALALLPLYPVISGADQVVVDVEGAPPIQYNITIPTTPVFPGNDVTWFSPSAEKIVFGRTLERVDWNGDNSTFILAVGRARLSLPRAMEWLRGEVDARLRPNRTITLNRLGKRINDNGHYTEQFAASMAIGELLVQSVGDIVRVLPAWPLLEDARFSTLRTQGGFLVSGGVKAGAILPVQVISTVGGELRILNPWPGSEPLVLRNGKAGPSTTDDQGILRIATSVNDRIEVRSPVH